MVLAAGAGTRVGGTLNKVLLPVAGVPIVARSVRTACAVAGVDRVVLVVRDGEQEDVRAAVEPYLPARGPEVSMVVGGASRHASEWAARTTISVGGSPVGVDNPAFASFSLVSRKWSVRL